MGNLDRRRAIRARHAPPFATMAVVCRGPRRKGSLPTARQRAHHELDRDIPD
jgi:hypothetical protein